MRRVVGVDLTPILLDVGTERLAKSGVRNVVLQEGNAASLPFFDGSFDIVCCRSSLHHLADPQRAVAEMVRTRRPGGRVVLNDLVAPSRELRDAFDDLHRLVDPSHRHAFVDAEVVDLLGSHLPLTQHETSVARLPLDIALTAQSDRDAVLGTLRAELVGEREPTGFEPAEIDGTIVVSFPTSTVAGVRPISARTERRGEGHSWASSRVPAGALALAGE